MFDKTNGRYIIVMLIISSASSSSVYQIWLKCLQANDLCTCVHTGCTLMNNNLHTCTDQKLAVVCLCADVCISFIYQTCPIPIHTHTHTHQWMCFEVTVHHTDGQQNCKYCACIYECYRAYLCISLSIQLVYQLAIKQY